MRRLAKRAFALAAGAAALAVALAPMAPSAAGSHGSGAPIHPGVGLTTERGRCTSNFIFSSGPALYIGFAAHCAAEGSSPIRIDTCGGRALPLGTPVEIQGATRPGRLAYSSWAAMQAVNEEDGSACSVNDFAIVAIDPVDVPNVDPTIPFWGGPVALRTSGLVPGEKVFSYGNSSLRPDVEELKPKEGYSTSEGADGWHHEVFTVTPGIFGDSGSAFIDAAGSGFGVVTTLRFFLPASNGVVDLSRALAYMRAHGGPDVRLVKGKAPFRGPLLGPGFRPAPEPEPEPEPQPAPPPPPPPSGPPPEPPRAEFSGVPRTARAGRIRRISGTATASAQRVELSVMRREGDGCRQMTRSGRFGSAATCDAPTRWLAARGTASWTLRLRRTLGVGRYVLRARAMAAAGAPGPVARRKLRVT